MNDRPDPDRLLAAARAAEAPRRGRLKVYLGAAAGVGKTCAMLDAAHEARAAGRDVVVGLVEHHGRADTLRRLDGLVVVPRRPTRQGYPPELDLDAVLARRPEVVLVDELAHTNAPGSRHPKRWQDVVELVEAGIEVWTAVNVQHLETTHDVVARTTGVAVRETVPDAVIDDADEIEVVDLPPDALLSRLKEGRVYGPEATQRALTGFFRRGNLLALRELALRRAARRVGEQVDDFREGEAIPEVWSATDRLLVAVGPSPLSARLVRVAARLAKALDAPWHAVLVQTPELTGEGARRAHEHLALAERVGAQVATVSSDDVPAALVSYARAHNLQTVVLGASAGPWWSRALRPSLVEAVSRAAADLEIHVVPGQEPPKERRREPTPTAWPSPRQVGLACLYVAAATGFGWLLQDVLPESDLLMLYLLAVVLASFRLPRVASLLTAVGAVASFNFFFTHPRFSFYVSERRYLLTFAGLAGFGVLTSHLASTARERAAVAARRESEARALFRLGRELAGAVDAETIARVAAAHAHELLGVDTVVRLPKGAELVVAARIGPEAEDDLTDLATARWAFAHDAPAGPGTDTLPSVPTLHLPLSSGGACHGVLGVRAEHAGLDDPDRRHLLETLADQVALALARDALATASVEARRRAEAESARSGLLSAVSHDLRTPLATITGAATTLQSDEGRTDAAGRARLLGQIVSESHRLERLVQNLLQMTRLDEDAGPELDWQVAQEVVGSAVARVRDEAAGRVIGLAAPDEPVLVRCDALLVETALVNLLENALRHAPASAVEVVVRVDGDRVALEVGDRGPGIPADQVGRVFERFVRGSSTAPGTGLGLAIVAAVARAHGGRAIAEPRAGGGALLRVDLPVGGPDGHAPPDPEPDTVECEA